MTEEEIMAAMAASEAKHPDLDTLGWATQIVMEREPGEEGPSVGEILDAVYAKAKG